MICEPCRPVHEPADCIDSKARRQYPWRHCACQHRPRAKTTATAAEAESQPEFRS